MTKTQSGQLNTKLVDVREMAQILGVAESWLYQRTRLGSKAIPLVRVGKYVRFRPDEVVKFLERKQVGRARRR